MKDSFKSTFLFFLFFSFGFTCLGQQKIITGAEQIPKYINLLNDQNIGIVANKASIVSSNSHLIDTLLTIGINIKKVFVPEHGFRGEADAGEKIFNQKDPKTGLTMLSLYGSQRKPSNEQVKGISTMVFDLQDVGVRFYTYISTLHYIMEVCAEKNIPLIVLDRPNPNAHFIDGPVLEKDCKSFVGMHPVPIVYGMTIGEYALMINGEGWLANHTKCQLKVIKLKNYNHKTDYELPLRPSPNLPNAQAIALYPSLCLLEPTEISVGRGTEMQFQVFGHPNLPKSKFSFTPKPNFGAKYPKLVNQLCNGTDLRTHNLVNKIELKWILNSFKNFPEPKSFFRANFFRIAGTRKLKKQIEEGLSENEIRSTWDKGLKKFKNIRLKYLLY
ncbi:MAG: hypothetical protein CMC78_01975 [Flavobacteriaceae bacterium]|nr:hypothetical protein [Flavobacteriaceae bacterium]|tara:strand:+ start:5005 stop:6162 length:1158 start_codon:yes stop_codon:yes gene_type:complete